MTLKQNLKGAVLAAALFAGLGCGTAHAAPVFQSDAPNGVSSRTAFSSIVTRFQVSSTVNLTNFAVLMDLESAGNINFLIFNSNTGALLLQTGAGAYADDGATFKKSANFNFAMLSGITYGLAAHADVASLHSYVVPGASTQGAISSLGGNQNLFGTSFANYGFNAAQFGTDGIVQLFVEPAGDVPEPASMLLLGLGLAGLAAARRKSRA